MATIEVPIISKVVGAAECSINTVEVDFDGGVFNCDVVGDCFVEFGDDVGNSGGINVVVHL